MRSQIPASRPIACKCLFSGLEFMNIFLSSKRERGLTLLEIFVILAVISVLALLLIPALLKAKARARRIYCINHLMQIGLSCRVWEGDHTNLYPMQVSSTNGGTMDFIMGPNAFRHFQVMSNELSTPKVLICPAESDRMRAQATNFDFLRNSNISYFVGIDANETNPQLILSGGSQYYERRVSEKRFVGTHHERPRRLDGGNT
jgi:hypothetical protein